ncbi:hypothetical protein Tco_1133229 [Tanacetum coccineum]
MSVPLRCKLLNILSYIFLGNVTSQDSKPTDYLLKPIEDGVYLYKVVVDFGKKKKLAPRFVGPFKIIEKVGPVAYRLDFPKELDGVHDTFHVSNLKKCLADPTLQVPLDEAPGSPVRNEYVKNGQKQSKTDKTEHGNGKSREKSKPKEYTY